MKDGFRVYISATINTYTDIVSISKWDILVNMMTSSKENYLLQNGKYARDQFYSDWVRNCSLDSNKRLELLDSNIGGLGSNSDLMHKKIFYNYDILTIISRTRDHPIQMIPVRTETSIWNLDELKDLSKALRETCNVYIGTANCISSVVIETI